MWDIGHKSSQDTMARKVDRVQHRRNVLVRIRVRLSLEAADNLTVTWTECNHVLALQSTSFGSREDIFQAFSVHFGRRQELNKWNWDGRNWTTNLPPSYSITVEMYFSVPCLCAYKWLFWTQRPLNFWLETGSRMLQVNMSTTSIHTHTHTTPPRRIPFSQDNEKRTGRRRKLTLKTLCSWRPLCCMDSVTND